MHDVVPPELFSLTVLLRPAKRERSTFFEQAPTAAILKVSRVGFKAGGGYGIFAASIS
jgi:hypothetical protein